MKMVNRRAAGSRHTSAKACRKGGFAAVPLLSSRATAGAVSTPQTASDATAKAIAQIVDVTAMSRVFENGSRKMPARGAEITKPRIIIIQTADAAEARRRGSTCVASIARTEVPAEPAPIPSKRKESAATDKPRGRERRRQRRSKRRSDSAECEGGHPPDDPGRPASADVRPVAPGGPQNLNGVMRGDQKPWNDRGQSELHYHHAIDGGRHEDNDRAQHGLNEAEPDDFCPSKGRGASYEAYPIERTAKALTNIPMTYNVVPVAL